jgi:hypothetical protein
MNGRDRSDFDGLVALVNGGGCGTAELSADRGARVAVLDLRIGQA